ncbi:MAG: DUF4149 domain-containing protein [Pseudohongiellaceae bacterium]
MKEEPTMSGHRPVLFTISVLAVLWAGLLLGVSFLATPVKFMAPSLTLPVALDVGRQTFMVFNWVEIALAVALIALLAGAPQRWIRGVAVAVALIVALQTLWLLPLLDARVQVILEGSTPPPSQLHTLYIAADTVKLILLGVLGMLAFRSLGGVLYSRQDRQDRQDRQVR